MLDFDKIHHDIRALQNGKDSSRRYALQSLKQLDEKTWAAAPRKVIHSLLDALQRHLQNGAKQTLFRHEVVTILGNLGPRSEPALPQLIDMLRDDIADGIRDAAAIALGKMGRKARIAVDPLINVLANCRTSLAIQVVRSLSEIGCADERVRTALNNLWLSSAQSPNIQVQVAIALCKLNIDTGGLLRFLTSTLVANHDACLRKSAAEALAWCDAHEPDVVPALLVAARNDKDEKIRPIAEAGLARLRLTQAKAIHLCARQLKESAYAETALRNCGALAMPALIAALGSAEADVREKAARILGCLGETAAVAVPALTRALRDKDLLVRLAAAKGLWNITKNSDVVVPALIDLLGRKWASANDAGESRRRYLQTVIEALQRIGPPAKAAIKALRDKARDKNRHISESALSALRGIEPVVTK